MNILKKVIGISFISFVVSFMAIATVNNINPDTPVGTSVTQITGSDKLSDLDTLINTISAELNAGKMEISTTTLPLITTLTGLTTVGTIGTGVWEGTDVGVAHGGTGSSTPTGVLYGDGAGAYTTIPFGTSGQFLQSNGAGASPTFETSAINQTADYTWTGHHIFSSLFGINASTTNATTSSFAITGAGMHLNGIDYVLPSSQVNGGRITTDGNGNLTWETTSPVLHKLSGARPSTSATGDTSIYTATIAGGTLGSSDLLRITAQFTNSGTTNTFTPLVKFGTGAATTTICGSGVGDNSVRKEATIAMQNSVSSEYGHCNAFYDRTNVLDISPISAAAAAALSYDSTNNIYVNISCSVTNGADTCLLSDFMIERITP